MHRRQHRYRPQLHRHVRPVRRAVENEPESAIRHELSANLNGLHMLSPAETGIPDGEGFGLATAARGGLGHWLQITNGVISLYRVVTPTTWNTSPKDREGRHGHWESSLIGLTVDDSDHPVKISHIIRSHSTCLVCTVHLVDTGKRITMWP